MPRFRFRRGSVELEIEYSGDVPADKEEVIGALVSQFKNMLEGPTIEPEAGLQGDPGSLKKSRRGGVRKAFVSPGIDELIKSKWLAGKTTAEVVDRLKTDGILGASEDNVNSALLRKVQSRVLTRTRSNGDWVWTIPTL